MNRVNDEMYKPEQQWITINAAPVSKDSEKSNDSEIIIDGKKSEEAESVASGKKQEKPFSLIDTFTGGLDNPSNMEQLETYRVKGDVGSLIAQKLLKGEKIRVCRNGEPVNVENDITEEEEFTMALPVKKRFFFTFFFNCC
jgi:hypothetical protein